MYKSITILTIFIVVMISCKGEFDPTEEEGQVELIFPENAEVCPDGDFLGSSLIQIPLLWKSDTDFTKYKITIEDSQGQEVQTEEIENDKRIELTLNQGELYYWYVIGQRGKEKIPSDTWSFYTQGAAIENYIPYPALLNVNLDAEDITISWVGKDQNTEDILSYDVYLSTENPPTNLVLEGTELTSYSEDFTTGFTYYVQVITYDNSNTSSKSQILSFTP